MGIIAGIFSGLFGPHEDYTDWHRDQDERGGWGPKVEGTRASATLRAENQAGIQSRYDAVTERGREANPEEDRRGGGDRRGIF